MFLAKRDALELFGLCSKKKSIVYTSSELHVNNVKKKIAHDSIHLLNRM